MATRRALRLLLVLSTKKQNCFCQLLSDTRQRTHRYTNNHIQKKKKKSWTHPTGEGKLLLHSTPSQEAAENQKMLSLWCLTLIWAQGGSTLGPPLLVTWGAQVQLQFILECLLCICIWDARAYVLLFYCNFGLKK